MAKEKTEKTEKTPKEKKPLTFNKFWCIWNLVEAGIILVAGVLAIIMGATYNQNNAEMANNVAKNVLPFVIGAFIAADAALRVIMGVKREGKETDESIMLIGGFELTIAILVMIFHSDFTRLVMDAISVLLMVIGALLLLFSILTIAKKSKKLFVPILEILFAAILVAIGIIIMVVYHNKTDNNQIVLIVSGGIFTLVGIAQIVITLITLHKANKEEKSVGEITILDTDGSAISVKEEEKPALENDVFDANEAQDKRKKK